MRASRVEDLECWREARILVNMVFTGSRGRAYRKDVQLRNHVTGASLDVMNFITEGYETHSDSEFVRQLRFAMRSISEVQTTLYAALDLKYFSKKDFMKLYDQMQKTRKSIEGYRQRLSGRQGGSRGGRQWRGNRRNRGSRPYNQGRPQGQGNQQQGRGQGDSGQGQPPERSGGSSQQASAGAPQQR